MSDCAFLYELIGGFGKIALSFGWFWIRYQFSIIVDLMFGAAVLNVVTKGKICLFVFGFDLSVNKGVNKRLGVIRGRDNCNV